MAEPLQNETARRIARVAKELQDRKTDALRMFRPMEQQVPFFISCAQERVLRGGNRSGKTMCAAIEFASAVTGIPVCDVFGNVMPFKWPRNKPLNTWVIGYDQNHIGKTMYRYLFMPGAFSIIRDEASGEWRAFNPITDEHRRSECRQAPPLIPSRLIDPKGWAWEDKANRVFSVCRLKNGTEIRAFSSKGHAAMGDSVDLIWIDEDIEHPEHVREWEMRLPSVNGRLIWSAFPLSKNDALRDLHERAEREKHMDNPVVSETVIKFQDNAYISEQQVQARKDGMSEEEWKARNDGEFSSESILMFPSFHIDTHGVPQRDERFDDEVDRLLRQTNGVPPADWTRYLIVDPGHTLAAVMFAAVAPPDKFGELYYVYDELYLRLKSAEDMAKAVRLKTTDVGYEAFIMDYRAGRQTPMGYSSTIMENYSKAFAAEGLKSRLTNSSFIWGSDDIENGNDCVRSWLRIQANGKPRLRIARHLEAMKFEFARYRKQVVGNLVKEKQVDRDNHLMSCLRYFSAYQPEWHPPIIERIPSRMERLMGTLDAMFGKSSTPSGPIRLGVGASS